MLNALFQMLFGENIKAQQQKVEDAIRVKAQRIGDLEYERTMANFYTDRSMSIDPQTDWWGFADAKQKQHDHQLAFVACEGRVEVATARVAAETARYVRLLDRSADTGAGGAP